MKQLWGEMVVGEGDWGDWPGRDPGYALGLNRGLSRTRPGAGLRVSGKGKNTSLWYGGGEKFRRDEAFEPVLQVLVLSIKRKCVSKFHTIQNH